MSKNFRIDKKNIQQLDWFKFKQLPTRTKRQNVEEPVHRRRYSEGVRALLHLFTHYPACSSRLKMTNILSMVVSTKCSFESRNAIILPGILVSFNWIGDINVWWKVTRGSPWVGLGQSLGTSSSTRLTFKVPKMWMSKEKVNKHTISRAHPPPKCKM